jgi:cell division protein FtsL
MQQLWAREMKKEKRKQAVQEAAEVSGEGATLRQKVATARLAKEAAKEKVKEKVEERVMAPARTGTTWTLREAWIYLIPSWGLTFIWIDIHVFLHMIFPRIFGELGSEWTPKQLKAVVGEKGREITAKSFGIIEKIIFVFCNVILFFIIMGLVSLFVNESTLNILQKDSAQQTAQTQNTSTAPTP